MNSDAAVEESRKQMERERTLDQVRIELTIGPEGNTDSADKMAMAMYLLMRAWCDKKGIEPPRQSVELSNNPVEATHKLTVKWTVPE